MMDFSPITENALLLACMARAQNFTAPLQAHIEKIWHYHTYEGSSPASMIDWHQSARTEVPLSRTAEPVKTTPLYLWMDGSASPALLSVFLAVALLNISEEHPTCWLEAGLHPTLQKDHISHIFQNAIEKKAPFPLPFALTRATIILAAPFHKDPQKWEEIIVTFQKQGCQLCLLPMDAEIPENLAQRIRNLGSPLLPVAKNLSKKEDQLALLYLLLQSER